MEFFLEQTIDRLGHKTSTNKFRKTEIVSGIYLVSQWNETKSQQKQKLQKLYKYKKTGHHNFEQKYVVEEVRGKF